MSTIFFGENKKKSFYDVRARRRGLRVKKQKLVSVTENEFFDLATTTYRKF
jgi:hypothetical protein